MASPSHIQRIGPNSEVQDAQHLVTVFLSGPIVPWRDDFIGYVESFLPPSFPITIFDPTQPLWDDTWSQDYSTDHNYKRQVDWEIERLSSATVVVTWFDKKPKAPITLLELGLCVGSGRAVVGCQEGYAMRGNVQAVCFHHSVSLEDTLEGLARQLVKRVVKVETGIQQQ